MSVEIHTIKATDLSKFLIESVIDDNKISKTYGTDAVTSVLFYDNGTVFDLSDLTIVHRQIFRMRLSVLYSDCSSKLLCRPLLAFL
jgi:hypothetical protein